MGPPAATLNIRSTLGEESGPSFSSSFNMLFRSLHVPAPSHRPRQEDPLPPDTSSPLMTARKPIPDAASMSRALDGARRAGCWWGERPFLQCLWPTLSCAACSRHRWAQTPPRAAFDSVSTPVQDAQVPGARVVLLHDRWLDLLRWIRGCAPASAQLHPAAASAARAEDFPTVALETDAAHNPTCS